MEKVDWNDLMSTLTDVAARNHNAEILAKDGTVSVAAGDDQETTIILELAPGTNQEEFLAAYSSATGGIQLQQQVVPQQVVQVQQKRLPSTLSKKSQCPYCEKEFNAAYLVQHIRIHTGEKPFNCEFCNKSFRASIDWKNHRRVHTGERPYKCKVCSKTFKQNTNLLRHQIRHTDKKPFQCDICMKNFWSMWGMQTHRRAHLGEYSFSCKQCNDRFVTKGQLDRHNLIHEGKELFKCQVCSRLFTKERHLELHLSRHQGLASGSALCELCGQGYARRESLARHMKKVHGMEYIYPCEACGKPFMSEQDRLKHSVIHMDGTCPICGKIFRRKLNLRNHIVAHVEGTSLANIDEEEMEKRRRRNIFPSTSSAVKKGPASTVAFNPAHKRRGRPPKNIYVSRFVDGASTSSYMNKMNRFQRRDQVRMARVSLRLHLQLLREMKKEMANYPMWKRRDIMLIHRLRGRLRVRQMKQKSYCKKILASLKSNQLIKKKSEGAVKKVEVFDEVENAVAKLHGLEPAENAPAEPKTEILSRPNPPLRTFERSKKGVLLSSPAPQVQQTTRTMLPPSVKKPSDYMNPALRKILCDKGVMTTGRVQTVDQGIMTEVPWPKLLSTMQGTGGSAGADCDRVPILMNKNSLGVLGWPFKSIDDTLKQVTRHTGHTPLDGVPIQVIGSQGIPKIHSCTAVTENNENVMLSVQSNDDSVLFLIPIAKPT